MSAEIPDWERERPRAVWDPARRLLQSMRRYQRLRESSGVIARGLRMLSVLEHRFWSAVTASDIPINSKIAGGLLIVHPNGIVIHPDATVGANCLILQQVTLAAGVQVGGHVDIGAGAKVIRPVRIGDHAKIGANAVVLCDVPDGATAVGIPARILPRGGDR